MSVSIPVNGTIWERRMNKKKYSLDKYWEDKLNLRYEEEILRYKMLCNDKIPKRVAKKYNINPRYSTFGEWEKYIKEKISKISNEELIEYQRYINLKRTNVTSISELLNVFFIPFLIALISPLIVEGLKACTEVEFDNIIAGIIYFLFIYFLLICGGLLIIKNLSKEDREQKRNQLFYNDIYEIVQKEIEKRSNYTYLI